MLPFINALTSPSKISQWKSSPKVSNCYKKLFFLIDRLYSDITYMSRILDRLWSDMNKAPIVHVAFVISTCENTLNLKVEGITNSESIIKKSIKKNMVIFFLNNISKYLKLKFIDCLFIN